MRHARTRLPSITPKPLHRLLVGLLLNGMVAGLAAAQTVSGPGSYAFVDVTVIPMDAPGTLPEQTVVVQDGRIVAVGPTDSIPVPPTATRIEGEGRFLIPGLVDMVARLPAEDDPLRAVVLDEWLYLYLANGVTRLRAVDGSPYQLGLKEQIATDAATGPTLHVGGPDLDEHTAADPAAAEALVREHAAAGYEFISLTPTLSPAAWLRAAEVAAELQIPIAGGAPVQLGVESALQAGPSSLDGLEAFLPATRDGSLSPDAPNAELYAGTDPTRLEEIARATAASGVAVVPMQYLHNHLHGWNHVFGEVVVPDTVKTLPEYGHVPQAQRNTWATTAWNLWVPPHVTPESAQAYSEWRKELLSALHSAGVTMLVGTGATDLLNVAGFAMHRELPLMAAAGMSTFEVLQAATTNAAAFAAAELGHAGDFGAVKEGYIADLVLLAENPLSSLDAFGATDGVMVRGTWLPKEQIAERLAEIAERHKDYEID
jgi:imidazolonepropionase-like amidohydrolase